MRLLSLLEDGQLSLTSDILDHIPPYAILSHTWGKDEEEVSFPDLTLNIETKKNGYGYRKIKFCSSQAAAHGLRHFWVDTCCINKTSSAELQEAITSMFQWYQNSTRCYVYLPDVQLDEHDPAAWQSAFRKSRWFTRGWTLQELLAPSSVEFFDKDGIRLGDKASLQDLIHEITGISIEALQGRRPLSTFSVDERFLWARGRETKRKEDKAYSLWGIFGVSMFSNYGEGEDHAMRRLCMEIEHPVNNADPKTHRVVPLGRNRAFVGRHAILDELLNIIPPQADMQDCQRVAIEGLGGIGKTQIALEVAFRLQERDPDCSVFWVPAVSQATFENGYRNIGRALSLPGIDNDNDDVKALVATALGRSTSRWCLIIDNLDDTELLTAAGENYGMGEYLPFSTKGSILFTTRTHEITTQLDISLDRTYSIDEMSENEALKMLATALRPKQMQDSESTRALLELLSYLPLAIKQAIAYMSRTGVSTKSYLENYRLSDYNRITLLSRHFEDRGRYRDIANPIATTWLVSFSHIERNHPMAAQYLKMICLMAEKDIPSLPFSSDEQEYQLEEVIGVLLGYSFITERDDGGSFDMHRLVRVVTRNSIGSEFDRYLLVATKQLSQLYPEPTHANKDSWMRYLPHAEVILNSNCSGSGGETTADLLYKVGQSYHRVGKFSTAEKMLRQSFRIMEKELGPNRPKTLRYKDALGVCLNSLGRYKESEQIHREVLYICQQELGPRDPVTLRSMCSLADALHCLDAYDEAEQMSRDAFSLHQEVSGPRHEDTLRSMYALASNLEYRGRYVEAEDMHRQLLRIFQEEYEPTDPRTQYSMGRLGFCLKNLEKYGEAENIFRQVLEARLKDPGPRHRNTLGSMNSLALVLCEKGEYHEAEPLHREVLKIISEELGPDHPDTLTSLCNLGRALMAMGKCEEAEMILRQVAQASNETLGPAHPTTLDAMSSLARLLKKLGRHSESVELQEQSLDWEEMV